MPKTNVTIPVGGAYNFPEMNGHLALNAGDVVTFTWDGATTTGGSSSNGCSIHIQDFNTGAWNWWVGVVNGGQTVGPGSTTWTAPYTGNFHAGIWIDNNNFGVTITGLSEGAAVCTGPQPGTNYTPPALPAPPTGFPTAPTTTCGTIQDVCNSIQTISNKLDWMRTQVDLIQRQSVPFAYLRGTSHAASGSGSFTVQGIIGLAIAITTAPSWIGQLGQDPTAHFQYGWIHAGTADGWEHGEKLLFLNQLVLPLSGAVTVVGYDLTPGVTATITELLREA